MNDFVMRAEDEMTHRPDPSVNFNESVYTNGFDTLSGRRLDRLGNRVNEGHAELSVCLYLPDGRIACQFQPAPHHRQRSLQRRGLSYRSVEPLKQSHDEFDGEMLIVDDPEAFRDPKTLFANGAAGSGPRSLGPRGRIAGARRQADDDAVQTMYGRDFSLGHFNQHAASRGEIKVGSETFPIDGRGWRDHSWGPRYWQAIHWYRLFIANFPNGDGLMLLKITGQSGVSRRVGVLWPAGSTRTSWTWIYRPQWSDQKDPRRVETRRAHRKPQSP